MTHLRRSFWAVFGDLFFKNCTYYRLYLREKMSLTLFNFSQRHELPGLTKRVRNRHNKLYFNQVKRRQYSLNPTFTACERKRIFDCNFSNPTVSCSFTSLRFFCFFKLSGEEHKIGQTSVSSHVVRHTNTPFQTSI